MIAHDYSLVTEVAGHKVTREQVRRMHTRYRFAADLVSGKTVVDAACGNGQGLGMLADSASRVIGMDIDGGLLSAAASHYRSRPGISLLKADAQRLPLAGNSVDALILYEAVYYLSRPGLFFAEALRVLRPGGVLVVCSANKELADFNPSPFSHSYFSAAELAALLKDAGFSSVDCYADCPAETASLKGKAVAAIKRAAVKLGVMPRTMKNKEFLKRIFFGRLLALPAELPVEMPGYLAPLRIACDRPEPLHKVIFTVSRKPR